MRGGVRDARMGRVRFRMSVSKPVMTLNPRIAFMSPLRNPREAYTLGLSDRMGAERKSEAYMRFAVFQRVRKGISAALGRAAGLKRRKAAPARVEIGTYVNRIVSDALLFNEIPSPTENEEARADFILRRLTEFGYEDPVVDEHGNVYVTVPSESEPAQHVLLFADIRCEEYSPAESLTRLEAGRAVGKGIAENSLGVSALLVLAEYLIKNQIQFGQNLVLLFTAFDSGAPHTQPLEHFLREWAARLRFGVSVRGLGLGWLQERPMGTYKLVVTSRTPEREVVGAESGVSAIALLANAAFRLGSIRWDTENKTFLNVARMEAGTGFGWYPAEGILELEIFSEDKDALEMTRKAVEATISNLSTEAGATTEIAVKTFFPAGDAEMNAELNRALRAVFRRFQSASLRGAKASRRSTWTSLPLRPASASFSPSLRRA
jgi:acetylornithine deacetylase/succinyl-diaminopimelate desuccinylase-like protein